MIPKLTVLLVILFVAYRAADEKVLDCNFDVKFRAIYCPIFLDLLGRDFKHLDIENKFQVMQFNYSCDQVQDCFEKMRCGNIDRRPMKALSGLKRFCNAVVYTATDFADCRSKLKARNTKCFRNWSPFALGIDYEMELKTQIDGCSTYFGVNNCMKKRIIKTCGRSKWNEFYDKFGTLSSFLYKCDVTQLS